MAGGVGSVAVQLARTAGAYVIGTGRTGDRQAVLDFGANEFLDLTDDGWADTDKVDVVFDVIGGDIGARSTDLVHKGGTLVTIAGPPQRYPENGQAIFFVVEANRRQLGKIAQRVRDGLLRTPIDTVVSLDDAAAAFNAPDRKRGKVIVRVRD